MSISWIDGLKKLDNAIADYESLRPTLFQYVLELGKTLGRPFRIKATGNAIDRSIPVPTKVASGKFTIEGQEFNGVGKLCRPDRFISEYRVEIVDANDNPIAIDTPEGRVAGHLANILQMMLESERTIRAGIDWLTKQTALTPVDVDVFNRLNLNLPSFPYRPSSGNTQGDFDRAIAEERPLLDGGRVVLQRLLTTPVASASDTPVANDDRRRGRLSKVDSDAMRTQLLAIVRQHPTKKDDIAGLAKEVGASESTIRRWLSDEAAKYRDSRVMEPMRTSSRCRHCDEGISGVDECPKCQETLGDECPECHNEAKHNEIMTGK